MTTFKIILKINTLENVDGILIEKAPEFEKKLELIQSRYWLSFKFFDQDIVEIRIDKIIYVIEYDWIADNV